MPKDGSLGGHQLVHDYGRHGWIVHLFELCVRERHAEAGLAHERSHRFGLCVDESRVRLPCRRRGIEAQRTAFCVALPLRSCRATTRSASTRWQTDRRAREGSLRLPAVWGVHETRSPGTPGAPVPCGIRISIRSDLLLICKMLCELVRLEFVVRLLRAHIKAAAASTAPSTNRAKFALNSSHRVQCAGAGNCRGGRSHRRARRGQLSCIALPMQSSDTFGSGLCRFATGSELAVCPSALDVIAC
jgi:hypothetical protein